ncbi:MAG: energy transducer TonB [Pseudomonadota bacterium]
MVNDGGRLAFVLPHKGGVGIVQGKTNIALQPSGKTVTATFVSVPLKERRSIVMVVGAQDVDDLVAAKTIGVQLERGVPIILQTGGMTGARQALRTCQEDLARQWGVDPADKIPDSDIPAIGTWFDGDAYPGEAIRSGAEGRTLALITIRDDGKVDTCRTLVSSGTKALDQAACRAAMRKARFPRVERDPKAKLRWLVVPVNWNLAS